MIFLSDCGAPTAPTHGTVALVGSVTTYQATATQSCDIGYSRSTGTGTITCLETGSWSTSYTCTIQGSSSFSCSCSTVLSTNRAIAATPPRYCDALYVWFYSRLYLSNDLNIRRLMGCKVSTRKSANRLST